VAISEKFINDLISPDGLLSPVLYMVKQDATLCLEIRRNNYINIYYRGGNVLKLTENQGFYEAEFDKNYLTPNSTLVSKELPGEIKSSEQVRDWVGAIPLLKHEMDRWFCRNPKNEREFQQLMLRENNFCNAAKGTDYFICDIEYADIDSGGRFDMIAIKWPSSSPDRKNNKNVEIAFIENKYMDNSLKGDAGIKKHIEDIDKFLSGANNLQNIKEEMKSNFNQKVFLGLISNQKRIESFKESKPEFIVALANHDPDSKILYEQLQNLSSDYERFELKFVVSNFMGYGLYKQNIYSLDGFREKFKDQIYSGLWN
jgi:hypothetical protein